jgi:hypothetical protein
VAEWLKAAVAKSPLLPPPKIAEMPMDCGFSRWLQGAKDTAGGKNWRYDRVSEPPGTPRPLKIRWKQSAGLASGAAIRMPEDDIGFIDLRPDNPGVDDPQARRLAVGRPQKLERMGLATAAGPGQWVIGLGAEPVLRDLGTRGDIIKTTTGRSPDAVRIVVSQAT